jgi:glyoxylase-like metal-dependent hydrolase (beta-lactamase superfamily II)
MSKSRHAFILSLLILSSAIIAAAVPSGGTRTDLKATRFSPRVLMVTDTKMNNNITAVRTSRGIVIIDTGESMEVAGDIRKLIEKEFPGIEFAYVINTHSHWDHVLGNPVFPEAEIVAHENCRDAMQRSASPAEARSRDRAVMEEKDKTDRPPVSQSELPPPPPAIGLVHIPDELFDLAAPDITFSDRMTMDCGGTVFRLVYFGQAHTLSDILVLVPEEKLLFVGDLFFKGWLPGFSEWVRPEVERWRVVLEELLGEEDRFEAVISGHGEVFPREEFEKQVQYRLSLWDGVSRAIKEGKDLAAIQKEFAIDKAYPELVSWNIKDNQGRTVHEENILRIWKHLKGE